MTWVNSQEPVKQMKQMAWQNTAADQRDSNYAICVDCVKASGRVTSLNHRQDSVSLQFTISKLQPMACKNTFKAKTCLTSKKNCDSWLVYK